MIEQDIKSYLVSLSTSAGARVYAEVLPEEPTYPALTFQKISGPRDHILAGSASMTSPRYQITAWGRDNATTSGYADAKNLAAQIVAAFDGHIGAIGSATVALQWCRVMDDHDAFEALPRVYMNPVDVQFFFNP